MLPATALLLWHRCRCAIVQLLRGCSTASPLLLSSRYAAVVLLIRCCSAAAQHLLSSPWNVALRLVFSMQPKYSGGGNDINSRPKRLSSFLPEGCSSIICSSHYCSAFRIIAAISDSGVCCDKTGSCGHFGSIPTECLLVGGHMLLQLSQFAIIASCVCFDSVVLRLKSAVRLSDN